MQQFDRWFKQLTRPWVVMLMVIFIIFSIAYWDRPLAVYLHDLDIKLHFPPLYWFSCLGETYLYLVLLLILALVYRYVIRNKFVEVRLWFLWLCVLFPSIFAAILKTIIGRARPHLWIEQHVYGVFGWHAESSFQSFPSGHTTATIGMMIGLMILLPRYKYLWMVWAICLLATRVLLTKHFLTDVVLSGYLVLLELGLLFALLRCLKQKKGLPNDLKHLCSIVS